MEGKRVKSSGSVRGRVKGWRWEKWIRQVRERGRVKDGEQVSEGGRGGFGEGTGCSFCSGCLAPLYKTRGRTPYIWMHLHPKQVLEAVQYGWGGGIRRDKQTIRPATQPHMESYSGRGRGGGRNL